MDARDIYAKLQPFVKKEIHSIVDDVDKRSSFKLTKIPAHAHNGVDSLPVSFVNVTDRKMWITSTLVGTQPATAANYGVVFISPFACTVTGVWEAHTTACSSTGTLNIEKLTGTQAPDLGSAMLKTAFPLAAAANTVQEGVLTDTLSSLNLAVGDRLCLADAGTLTDTAGLCVTIELSF
jgi:hypothetical protein